jgi:hypothetical protein
MQVRLKALLAEHEQKATACQLALETDNDELRKEVDDLTKVVEVKESLINMKNSSKIPDH